MTRKYYEWSDRYLDSERSNDKVDTSNINVDAITGNQIDGGDFYIDDPQSGNKAVVYDTDTSTGVLRTPNADLNASGNDVTGVGALEAEQRDISQLKGSLGGCRRIIAKHS